MSDSSARSKTAHLKEHQFRPGFSANPGGRPKASAAVAKLIREKTQDCAELVDLVLNVARGLEDGMDDSKSRAWAIGWLSDRALGKAPLVIETHSENETPAIKAPAVTAAQLEALAQLDIDGGLEVSFGDPEATEPASDEDAEGEPPHGDGSTQPN
jgi:hypothetical protein